MKMTTRKKISKPKIRRVGIAGLKKELAGFEKRYKMTTETFLQKVQSGEMDDTQEVMMWLALVETRQRIMKGRSNDA